MAKNKKQRLRTAYQRHVDFWKFTGIILLLFTLASVATVGFLLEMQSITQTLYNLLLMGVTSFFIGLAFCIIGSMKQSVADQINEKLYAVWKYKPSTIYKFYHKQNKKANVFSPLLSKITFVFFHK